MKSSRSRNKIFRTNISYPYKELLEARNEFSRRWSTAVYSDPVARSVDEAHCNFPPNITFKNCTEYPFEHDDPPVILTHSGKRQGSSVDEDCTKNKRKRFSVTYFDSCCCKLSEKAVFSTDERQSHTDSNSSTFFACDNCSYKGKTAESASQHLTHKSHASCSKYKHIITVDVGDDDKPDETTVCLLDQPRIIYNPKFSEVGWTINETAIYCPTCYLILPDKLTCAYHHQTQHPNHQGKFAYGKVLDVRRFTIAYELFCNNCYKTFSTPKTLLEHWSDDANNCVSPFLPSIEMYRTDSQQQSQFLQIVDVFCGSCQSRFDRVPPVYNRKQTSRRGVKRKTAGALEESCDLDTLINCWANQFGRFCIAHILQHVKFKTNECQLCIRFVQLQGKIDTLPSYNYGTDYALSLYCVKECRKLVTYLKHCRGTRCHLFRDTKKYLNSLLSQISIQAQ